MSSVRYNFSSTGAAEVIAAFKSIEQAAKGASSASRAFAGQGMKLRAMPGAPGSPRAGRAPAQDRTQEREAARWQKLAQKSADYRIKQEQKVHAATERAQSRSVAGEARTQKLRERLITDALKRQTRAQKEQARNAQRWAQSNARLRNERIGKIAGFAGEGARLGMGLAGSALAGASLVGGAALREGLDLQTMASKVAVQGRMPGEKAQSATAIRSGWEQAALGTPGAKAEQIGAAVSQFTTRTGRLDVAQQWQDQMAEIMVATDVAGADLGNTMATLFQKFGIEGTGEMTQAIADLTFQGKKGAFELSDMAAYMAEIGATTERFGGLKGSEGVRKVGGLMQIAKSSTGEAAEAKTALQSMFGQLVAKSDDIKRGAGFSIWKKGKEGHETKDINDVLVGVIKGYKGDQRKMEDTFDKRGVKAISPLIAAFEAASKGGKDLAAGEAAVREMLANAATTGAQYSDVQEDAAIRGQSASAQLTTAWESLKSSANDSLIPAFTGLATQLSSLLQSDQGAQAIDFLAEAAFAAADGLGELVEKLYAAGILDKGKADFRKGTRMAERGQQGLADLALSGSEQRKLAEIRETMGPDLPLEKVAEIAGAEGMDPERAKKWAKYQKLYDEGFNMAHPLGSAAEAAAAGDVTAQEADAYDADQIGRQRALGGILKYGSGLGLLMSQIPGLGKIPGLQTSEKDEGTANEMGGALSNLVRSISGAADKIDGVKIDNQGGGRKPGGSPWSGVSLF